jgi:hypothetical protein
MDISTQSLSEMSSEVLALLGKPSSAFLLSKIHAAINRTMDWAVKQGTWPTLQRQSEIGLQAYQNPAATTLLSGGEYFPFPQDCRSISGIFLQGNTGVEVEQTSAVELARLYDPSTTGLPVKYAIVGETIQHTEVVTAERICVKGDAVNNNVATVRVWYRSKDELAGEILSPVASGDFSTGNGAVIGQAEDVVYPGWGIQRVSTSPLWAGDIKLLGETSGTEYARVSNSYATPSSNPGSVTATRLLGRVGPTPDKNYKCTVIWERTPHRLVKNEDVPEIPCSPCLVYGAAADLLRADKKYAQAAEMDKKKFESLGSETAGEDQFGAGMRPQFGNFVDGTGGSQSGIWY